MRRRACLPGCLLDCENHGTLGPEHAAVPTVLTHAVVGWTVAKTLAPPPVGPRIWLPAILAGVLADLDSFGLVLGIPYGHPLGHRGLSHSLLFGLLLGMLLAAVFLHRMPCRERLRYGLVFSLAAMLHGPLDALTNGGLGVALFAPVSNGRMFFPVTPIEVSPIGLSGPAIRRLAAVLASEVLWVWLPCGLLVLTGVLFRRLQKRQNESDSGLR